MPAHPDLYDQPPVLNDQADGPATDAPRPSVSDIVFWGIVGGLEARQFVPGQRLVEADLMARFNVGRNAVREAMQRLAAEGIVDLFRHKGAAIRVLSREEVLDLLDIAERIFGLLAGKAARRGDLTEYGDKLKAIRQALVHAEATDNPEAFAQARRDFYRTLLAISGSRDLRRLFTTIHIPLVYAQQRIPSHHKIRLLGYEDIINAVLAADPDQADQAAVRHVQRVREALLNQFSRKGPE